MGLIKTAIMTGGGIYAVNKLVKSADHRYDSRAQQQQQYYGPTQGQSNNGYYSGPPPSQDPQGSRGSPEGYYCEPRRHGSYSRGPQHVDQNGERYSTPPPYGAQQNYQQNYQQGYQQDDRSPSPVAGLANVAMQFASSKGGRGGGDGRKGSDFVSELFRK